MSATPLLNIAGLTASVDEKTILQGIDLAVGAGETHVLMGPNGAGKSTMGHVIMGDPVYTVTQGTITFDGQDITDLSPDKRSRADGEVDALEDSLFVHGGGEAGYVE